MHLPGGALLKQRMLSIEAVLVKIEPELGLVIGVENLELELRDIGLDWISGSFNYDGEAQCSNHFRNLSEVLEAELARTGDSKFTGQREIFPFVQHPPKREHSNDLLIRVRR